MRAPALAAAVLALFAAAPSFAQAPAPSGTPAHIRGTVEKLDGNTLTVKTREGPTVSIALASDYKVATLVKASLADIKSGDYVASTGVKGTDGKLHAVEVRIFPESMRGAGEGQSAWDLKPDSKMTNATVTGTAKVANGTVLTVSYKGTTSDFVVDSDTAVLTRGDGDPSLLKPGAAVFVIARKQADGSLTAARLYAEKNGVKPPM